MYIPVLAESVGGRLLSCLIADTNTFGAVGRMSTGLRGHVLHNRGPANGTIARSGRTPHRRSMNRGELCARGRNGYVCSFG